jgi:antitoxin component of MazEF toxin-antitoxin module
MNGHIAKRGEEVVVLLDEPTSLADGTPVEVRLARQKPTLEELVAGITEENQHDAEDWGTERNPVPASEVAVQPEDPGDIRHTIDEIAAIDPTARMTLAEMIERITPETLHDYVDFGPPVGKEVW